MSPATISAPSVFNSCAAGLLTSRVNARTCQPSAKSFLATAPPCCPVAPVTAIILLFIFYLYSFRFLLLCDLITFMKQSDRLLHISFLPQIKTYPTGLRQNMVRLCASCGNDFITHFFGERNIQHVITMNMPNLAFTDHILHATEAMWFNANACPGCDRFRDQCLCTTYTHFDSLPLPNFLHNSASVCCSLADKTLNSSTNAAI